jgi:hypothetical protein
MHGENEALHESMLEAVASGHVIGHRSGPPVKIGVLVTSGPQWTKTDPANLAPSDSQRQTVAIVTVPAQGHKHTTPSIRVGSI